MQFTVRVESPTLGIPAREIALSEDVSTIGRDPACTIVLKDPDKFVSRRHANLLVRDGVCHLTVTSSANSAVVNGRTLACGQSVALTHGDRIVIAPFELVLEAENPASPAAMTTPLVPPPGVQEDPFRSEEVFPPPPPRPREAADPFSLPAAPTGGGGLLAGLDLPMSGAATTAEILAAPANLDPLAALEKSALRQAPQASRPVSRLPTPPAASPSAPEPSWAPGAREAADSLAEMLPNPFEESMAPPPPSVAAPEHVHAFNLPLTQAPAPAPAPASAPQAPASKARNLQALLDGLGLPQFPLPPGQEEAFFRLAGEIARTAIEGIIAILVSRGQLKQELGMADRTMLANKNNNPLKVGGDAREALRFLFDPSYRSASAFLPPSQAIRDACDDIFSHEVALVAATRAAVQGAIRRFDPARMEQTLEAEKSGGLFSNKGARLWEAYVEHYRKLEADMTDDIDAVFEKDFLRAYTEQVKRLKK